MTDPTPFTQALETMLHALDALRNKDTPETRLAFEVSIERLKQLHKAVEDRAMERRDRARRDAGR